MRNILYLIFALACLSILLNSCNSNTNPKVTSSSIKIEEAKKLQDRANVLLNNSNFSEAEQILKRAISLNSNSSHWCLLKNVNSI